METRYSDFKAIDQDWYSISVQMIAISLSEIAVVFLVNQHGEQATAAYGAVIQVLNFVQMPMLSLGMAAVCSLLNLWELG